MRVRPRLPQRPAGERRPHVIAPRPPASGPPPDAGLTAARRHRASVVPDDQATYRCGCGFVFAAAVSTTVACPHCGTGQAW